jgi:hypothetical protein
MFKLNEDNHRRKFIYNETLIFMFFFIFALYIISVRELNMAAHFMADGESKHVYGNWKSVNEPITVLVMSIVFFALVYYLNRYYKRELR